MEAIYDRSNGRVVSRHQMMRKYRFSVVMKHHYLALLIIPALISCGTAHKAISIRTLTVDKLGVDVGVDENREYSYTDKKAGFWYGRTHQDSPADWYAGWNQAKRRILSDYTLMVDGKVLARKEAQVCVYPDRLERRWPVTTETLSMVDNRELLSIIVDEVKGDSIGIVLNETLLKDAVHRKDALCYTPQESEKKRLKLVPLHPVMVSFCGNRMQVPASAGGFLIAYGTEEHCDSLIAGYRKEGNRWQAGRKARMDSLIMVSNPLHTNLPELDKAVDWITLTMDELITEQQGKGIYAGLPWFNEYWGRDMFIAMPGATLVTGQFEVTKEILKDFAQLQDRDTASVTCGRIPNRANLEDILYNTADGTPRYVIEAEELLRYSGDSSFLHDIYPSVVLSIDQSLFHHTDAKGYLLHEDADTWMDVKRNGIAGSPRGNRANDIQYLWYRQLEAGAHLARLMADSSHAETWHRAAVRLARNFEADYCNKDSILIYDHLNADGTPDLQYRPNQLYCFDLISDDTFKQRVTRRVWDELVYPWGVASLAQWDLQFHPQHENWNYYHKDDAYHNGTVWLWNNGIAMQRMIEYGQQETAWKLFKNMNRQALHEGAVGSLSENADAHPRKGHSWPNRSGTFLQAWSNSEQLRVWYQYFLGIRPDLMSGVVTVEPKLPAEITELQTSVRIGKGILYYAYKNGKFDVRLVGEDAKVNLILPQGSAPNPIFEGVDFCQPHPLDHYPCFNVYHDPPLTY